MLLKKTDKWSKILIESKTFFVVAWERVLGSLTISIKTV